MDRTDPTRWCTATDLADRTESALELAGAVRYLSLLDAAVVAAVEAAADVPALADAVAPWRVAVASQTPLARLDLDIGEASLVLEAMPALASVGVELLVPAQLLPAKTKVRGTAHGTTTVSSGRLGAQALVAWDMYVDDQPISETALERAAEAGASLIQVDGRWVRLDAGAARAALEELARRRAEFGAVDPLTLLRLSAATPGGEASVEISGPDIEAEDDIETTDADAMWLRVLLSGLPDDELSEGDVPEGFATTLRPYQLRALGWLQFLARLGLGGCLADDMGLGKTPTTLAHLGGRPGPHLVVCPLSVVRNWQAEAERFTPWLRTLVHHGTDRLRGPDLRRAALGADLVVSTYGLVARDLEELRAIDWSTLVLDEAQAVKNPRSKAARAVRKIPAARSSR
ncbi:MAG: SNF2-related protein [Ilumatobacteraceae bacterium]